MWALSLFILGLISGGIGVYLLTMSKSAMHETTAILFWVISAIFITGSVIVSTLENYISYLKGKLGEK